ncbi:NaeI family type II restriction endonuclease [Micrococcus luteus]|uniref:NaeI family type II restriction endonuclease n=1 Tax=Micrococcus luteus TaxID=1270 RepID=UPI0011A76F27|nr:NaeI family type II restriction endonuclease [Micrococcus luteus]
MAPTTNTISSASPSTATCTRDPRPPKTGQPPVAPLPPHDPVGPERDEELQTVLAWLKAGPIQDELTEAVLQSVYYILDGSSTGRVYLHDPEVDSDERSAVGVNLQYRVLNVLGLPKEAPLDTTIEGIPVDIKCTTGKGYGWMIPPEAQCEICLLVKIDAENDRFSAYLMRTHRVWLNEGGNQDKKRTITSAARKQYAVPLFEGEWAPLPRNPLRDLTPDQRELVLNLHPDHKRGQETRMKAMFSYLPGTVVPRHVLETIGAGRTDPARRARGIRGALRVEFGLILLCGKWMPEREAARSAGFELTGRDWVAVPEADLDPHLLQLVLTQRD